MKTLEKKFEDEVWEKMVRAKRECGYNAARFHQMLGRWGGVETARRLIANAQATGNTSDGFTTLYLCGRLDLTVEDSVCKEEFAPLFTPQEIAYCNEVLGRTGGA